MRLKEGDKILISFDTSREASKSDRWTAKVLPAFSWSLSDDIYLNLYRPRVQSQATDTSDATKPFVRTQIPCGDLFDVNDEHALAAAVKAAPVCKVRAETTISDTTARRQGDAIQACQRGQRRAMDPILIDEKKVQWIDDNAIKRFVDSFC